MRQLVVMFENGNGVSRSYQSALKWQFRIMTLLFEKFMQQATAESFSEYFQETLKYIGDLYNFDRSGPNVFGASKVLEDSALFISGLEMKRHKCFEDITNSVNERIECLDNDEMMQTLIKARLMLQGIRRKFLHRSCQIYRDLMASKRDEISLTQATVRHLLSLFAEYAGNAQESLQYRNEAEQIIEKISQINNQDVDELRTKCFRVLPYSR